MNLKSKQSALLLPLCTSIMGLITFILSSTVVYANTDITDKMIIGVPMSCTLSGTGMDSHTASIANGQSNSAVGETTLKAFCNDDAGFAIYAIGYTDNEDGKNVLTSTTLGSSHDIITGTATSGDSSKWAMKLSTITSPTPTYPIAIQNSFDSFHQVPDEYTLVAKRLEGTDSGTNAEGSTLKTTYQVYISSTQPTGAYSGKVKYILVHPNSTSTPRSTMLDTGETVAVKMKSLAAGQTVARNTLTSEIKAIRMADELPADFVPSEANTVSTSTSRHPIYIFFDNTNDAGIMYFYTGGYQVVMNPDSSHLFRSNLALSDISGLADWDSSNVTTMYALFVDSVVELTNVDALARWDTSRVEDMTAAFAINGSTAGAGYRSKLADISGLMNWNTSSLINMFIMFQNASSLTSLHGMEYWDVSKVEDLHLTFACGNSCMMTLSDISALSNWKTSSVTTMQAMFQNNGALTDLSPLANWDTSSVTTMYGMFFDATILTDLTPLTEWDVSNVTDMGSMFQNVNIASFLPLSKWDVGKVQNFSRTFDQTNKSTVTTLAGLEKWNVSSATNMSRMFADSVSLTDASAINGWDIRGVVLGTGAESTNEGFNRMFNKSPVHPTFTLLPGTWNSNGTFIPST
ncbi:BspA family leucine-rich repeat surface protein [Candidatus Saccharibacteria bacterium]|nr:BspA family leucine-rich repeat surface protein [Candidatus Saccharibacteria bacterium]